MGRRRYTKLQRRRLARWGRKGGRAMLRATTPEQRRANARRAIAIRWASHRAAKLAALGDLVQEIGS